MNQLKTERGSQYTNRIATTNNTIDSKAQAASFKPRGRLSKDRSRPHPKVKTAKTAYIGNPMNPKKNTKERTHETTMLIESGSSADGRGHLPRDKAAINHVM